MGDCNSGIGEGTDSNGSKLSQPISPKTSSFVPSLSQTLVLRSVDALLTVRDVAAALKLSTISVYALCDRGELPHVRIANAIRIPAAALRALTTPKP